MVRLQTKPPEPFITTAPANFPVMSFDRKVCFFVMYHYETNAILATPIPGLDNASILATYIKNLTYISPAKVTNHK